MTVRPLTDTKTPIGELLHDASAEGPVLEAGGRGRYAVIPLDDDLLDYLVARSPKLIDACRQIRQRMRGGRFHTHEGAERMSHEG